MDINIYKAIKKYSCPMCLKEYEKGDLLTHLIYEHDLTFNDFTEANIRLTAIGCPIEEVQSPEKE